MKYYFALYTFSVWMFCMYISVTGASNVNCGKTYNEISTDCGESCTKRSRGLYQTISCHHYCFCPGDKNDGHNEKTGITRTCPDGMVFNHLIENCDSPQHYKCPERPAPPANYKCPESDGEFPFPGCCGLYIHCSNNKPLTSFCTPNLHFSVKEGRCEYPDKANCNAEINDTTPTSPTEDTSPAEVTSTETITPAFTCPIAAGHFPDKNNCSQYIRCSNFVAYKQPCSKDQYFNPYLRTCDQPYSTSGCRTGENAKKYSKPIGNCCINGMAETDENDCSKFYFCDYEQLFYENCPEGFVLNDAGNKLHPAKERKEICLKEKQVIQTPCTCQNLQTTCNIPDDQDFYHYIRCLNGKGKRQKCYLGQRFNNTSTRCDIRDCERNYVF